MNRKRAEQVRVTQMNRKRQRQTPFARQRRGVLELIDRRKRNPLQGPASLEIAR